MPGGVGKGGRQWADVGARLMVESGDAVPVLGIVVQVFVGVWAGDEVVSDVDVRRIRKNSVRLTSTRSSRQFAFADRVESVRVDCHISSLSFKLEPRGSRKAKRRDRQMQGRVA